MQPAISVVMPAYNVAAFVDAAVDSILGQSFGDFELIAIDDGSTDGTRERLRERARLDRRVRLIEHARNRGLVESLNEGLAVARGPFIARMDSDDISAPRRFELQMQALQKRPSVVVLGAQGWFMGQRRGACHRPVGVAACMRRLPFDNPLLHNAVLMRTQWLRDRGLYYREQAQYAEDYDLWVQVAERGGEIDNLAAALVGYRVHGTSITQSRAAAQEATAQTIRARQWARAGVVFDDAISQILTTRQFSPGWALSDHEKAALVHVARALRRAGYCASEVGRFVLSTLPRPRTPADMAALVTAAARIAPFELSAFVADFALGAR